LRPQVISFMAFFPLLMILRPIRVFFSGAGAGRISFRLLGCFLQDGLTPTLPPFFSFFPLLFLYKTFSVESASAPHFADAPSLFPSLQPPPHPFFSLLSVFSLFLSGFENMTRYFHSPFPSDACLGQDPDMQVFEPCAPISTATWRISFGTFSPCGPRGLRWCILSFPVPCRGSLFLDSCFP